VGVEGFVNVRQLPLVFYGGTVSKVDCKFSHWVTCISQNDKQQLCLQLVSTVRNGGLGREGIGTSMMMQLVDCTIDTS